MDDNQNSAIKLLVDALSKSLQNLSDKINSYQSILTHIDNCEDKELVQITTLINSCNNLSKVLDTTTNDFYNKLNTISESVNTVKNRIEKVPENIKDEHEIICKRIEFIESIIKKEIGDVKTEIITLDTSVKKLNTDIDPISKLADMISKPLGLLVFIIGLILASITIVNGLSSVSDWFKTSKENVRTYIQAAPQVDTITPTK